MPLTLASENGNFDNTGYSIPEDTVGNYLDPASWKCTMIWSAYMGLPLSLEGVGTVLGLGKQKLTEGKELIKYFCQPCAPTKANGGRTRNLPENALDKWSAFKRYNVRDVEVEMSIQENSPSSLCRKLCGTSITLTRKSTTEVLHWIWSWCIRQLPWTPVPAKS